MDNFVVRDSGKREEYASGMMRDTQEGKPDIDRVFDGPLVDRLAAHLTKGAAKYPDNEDGTPNWTLASGREELKRFRKSAVRHMRQWLRGDQDEDHFAATVFNMNCYEYVKGRLVVVEILRRAMPGEKGCFAHGGWLCERPYGHKGKHMAWTDDSCSKLRKDGEWE